MLSFSTLGCPDWSLNDILSTAKDLHYDGIEVRGIGGELDATRIAAFSPENADATQARLNELGLFIPILSSGAAIGVAQCAADGMQEAREYIAVASAMSIPAVRILCEHSPEPREQVDLALLARNYQELLSFAQEKKVDVLLETNGIFCNTTLLSEFFSGIDSGNAGIVYDIHHPFRYGHEQLQATISNIGKYIRHVHFKDSLCTDGALRYCLCGDGDIPIAEAVRLLKQTGYVGYYSLEWVKRWEPGLQEPGIAFPQYKMYMDNILK